MDARAIFMLQGQKIDKWGRMTFSVLGKFLAPVKTVTGSYARAWHRTAAARPFTVVLCYHRVVARPDPRLFNVERGIDAGLFERQMRFMLRHFRPVAAERAGQAPGATFAVTFDDGTLDNHEVAAPILDRLGITGTFFVVQDFVGTDRPFWWEELGRMLRETRVRSLPTAGIMPGPALDWPAALPLDGNGARERAHDRISAAIRALPAREVEGVLDRLSALLGSKRRPFQRDFPLMGWEHLRDLARRGHAIGGHSATHANLGAATLEELDIEAAEATIKLEAAMGEPVKSFALPYGHRGTEDVGAVLRRRTRVSAVFTTGGGAITAEQDRFDLPRIQLNRSSNFAWAYNVDTALGRLRHQSPKTASA